MEDSFSKRIGGVDASAGALSKKTSKLGGAALGDIEFLNKDTESYEGPRVAIVSAKVPPAMKEDFEAATEGNGATIPQAIRCAIVSYIEASRTRTR